MNDKIRDITNTIVACFIIFGLGIIGVILPDKEYSDSERRALATMPQLNIENILLSNNNSVLMDNYEKYLEDQFPLREHFRTINSFSSIYLLGKSENNNLCYKDGYIAKMEYSIDMDSVNWSLNRMSYINDTYLDNSNVFFTIIPDKNYYMSGNLGVYTYDYDEFIEYFQNKTSSYASFIDIRDHLALRNYYHTDVHWKQETLLEVSNYILYSMTGTDWSYSTHNSILCENLYSDSFAGVYYGQLSIPVNKDRLIYMDGHYVDGLRAYCYDTGNLEEIDIYDMEKGEGKDPYELFLSGSKALITIENPEARSKAELIVFRDSFGSSIAPLLAAGYSKVTLIDIRYISPSMVGRFVDFEDKDVLFMYSAQVLNNSVGQFNN